MDEQAFELLMDKLRDHDQKLDEILAWRYKLAGATIIVSTIGGVLVQVLLQKLGK